MKKARIHYFSLPDEMRKGEKLAGTTHNVFGIQTGIAIMFLVKCDEK